MVENLLWLARLLFLGLIYWFFFKLIRVVTVDLGEISSGSRPLGEGQPVEGPWGEDEGRSGGGRGNQRNRGGDQPVPALYLRKKPEQAEIYVRLPDGKEQFIGAGQAVPLGEGVSIGRNPDNQVVVMESFVSGRHARIYRQDSGYWVEDVGSTNGTFLNGKRLKKSHKLRFGDKIALGDTVFEFAR